MSYWPDGMKLDPIGQWPGPMTVDRRRAPFSSTLTSTKAELDRELRAIRAEAVRLQIAIPAGGKWRVDGFPRSDARPEHPGIILTMVTEFGALSYPCDTFTRWEDNLRAITLSLEALRKVDRYGVTRRGEQYRGFQELEAPAPDGGFTSTLEARDFIALLIHDAGWTTIPGDLKTQLNQAKRLTHPDMGGQATDFHRVMLAEQYLTENGHI